MMGYDISFNQFGQWQRMAIVITIHVLKLHLFSLQLKVDISKLESKINKLIKYKSDLNGLHEKLCNEWFLFKSQLFETPEVDFQHIDGELWALMLDFCVCYYIVTIKFLHTVIISMYSGFIAIFISNRLCLQVISYNLLLLVLVCSRS